MVPVNVVMPKVGDQLGYYVIERVLGEGAQAKVFLAQNRLLKRLTALKVFKRAPDTDSHVLREARTIAALEHPNIVRIFQLECVDQLWFLAQEFVNHGAVSDRLQKGPLPIDQVFAFAQDAAAALAHAHAHGVLHNDLKPQNLLIHTPVENQARDILKLVDFGLASAGGGQDIIGTPIYMAPEIWQRQGPSVSSDLYSLGACLYHMAVGHPPFAPAPSEILKQAHLQQIPKIPNNLPSLLRRIIAQLLAKKPEERPADAQAVLNLLSPSKEIPATATPIPEVMLNREAASWCMRGIEEAVTTLPYFKKVVEKLSSCIALIPPLLLLECHYPQMMGTLIRHAIKQNPGMELSGRFLVSGDPNFDQEHRFQSLSNAENAQGLFHVHLERALTPKEAERLMSAAEAAIGPFCLLLSGTKDCLEPLREQIHASGRNGLAREYVIDPLTQSDLRSFLQLLANTAGLRDFTAGAILQVIAIAEKSPANIELILHNAIALTRLTRQMFVTTWAIAGAQVHQHHIDIIDDIISEWRKPPRVWPPERNPGGF